MSDVEILARHRAVWERRPELRAVYGEWFERLAASVAGLAPVVEIGAGAGFLKEFVPRAIATDVLRGPRTGLCCDAGHLPFRDAAVGALVMVDTLHHLPRPLEFVAEAARVLRRGGRVAMVEPWITPASYLLYRYLHHEDCRLGVDLECPFGAAAKAALDGNAAIPSLLMRRIRQGDAPLRVHRAEPFVAVPYLATFGFKVTRPLPPAILAIARIVETTLRPFTRVFATRAMLVLEKHG